MTLHDYIKVFSPVELTAFAARCATTPGQIKQVAGGYRRPGEYLAINIDRETGGLIPCESLRPDVDWAYLRGTAAKQA
jgi:DNA-binding transcriptional regulator YdaS (Cro superfamily)